MYVQTLREAQDISGKDIQICGKVFHIDEVERIRGKIHFSSTAHPLFLTENLSQVIVMLKGLKTMAGNPLYGDTDMGG